MSSLPDFRSREFLVAHMRSIMDFYYPRCINEADGGYYNFFLDDGTLTDRETQHLVSTTRFIVNFSLAASVLDRPEYLTAAEHGLRHLDLVHRDTEHGGYFWQLDGREPSDPAKHAYGHAFVLLAYACALKAGIPGMRGRVEETWDLLEKRFWEPEHRLYADEISRDWREISPYRGQNANMHMTEAMLAAYEATNDIKYLDRAETLARRVCVDLADQAGGLIWEHYGTDWTVDWDYNKDDPDHLFRPYGILPGHLTEWTKLLLLLEKYRPADWMLPKAAHLYKSAMATSADLEWGGMHYSVAPDGRLLDRDKYHWVHAETLAAAAVLAVRTGEARYQQDYNRLWAYCWRVFADHDFGAWYRILSPDGARRSDLKSPPGKTDYHNLGACLEILRASSGPESRRVTLQST